MADSQLNYMTDRQWGINFRVGKLQVIVKPWVWNAILWNHFECWAARILYTEHIKILVVGKKTIENVPGEDWLYSKFLLWAKFDIPRHANGVFTQRAAFGMQQLCLSDFRCNMLTHHSGVSPALTFPPWQTTHIQAKKTMIWDVQSSSILK